jgi:broad specificity phosphatase PhoE
MRVLLRARHGQSLFNVDGVINGDPARDRGLSPHGEEEALRLQLQIAAIAIDACFVSRFPRAHQTARIALGARADTTPWHEDPDLDDIKIGDLEGQTLDDYRAWKAKHTHDDPFPGGESLNDAARRYADALERIARRDEEVILCVCHEIPVRYAANGAASSDQLDAPLHDVANATPYVFDADGVARAVARMRELARPR